VCHLCHLRSYTSMSSAAAQYKKQDGTVTVSADGKTVSWKSASGAVPPLSIVIAEIGSMRPRPQCNLECGYD
jgi:transcription initiation factor TFIIH subunit 1